MEIPFSIPFIPKLALQYISEAFNLSVQQGGGKFTKTVENQIQDKYSGYTAFLTPSCTASLELSLMLLDVGPGDEVILPSFNFTSAATAITRLFATPVFVDIELSSGNLNLYAAERAITPRTKAIIWVNYAGNELNHVHLQELAQSNNLSLIEDAAHNFGVLTQSQISLTSDFVTFSFHASKNVQCGEGGALLIKSQDHADRARVMVEKGTNRYLFERGQVSKYNWVDKGGSFLLAEINSALLLAQIESFDFIQESRQRIIDSYKRNLSPHIHDGWSILKGTEKAAHIFGLVAPNPSQRQKLLKHLNKRKITAVSHYEDLASSPAGLKYGRADSICETSKDFSMRIIRMPLFVGLKTWQISHITEEVCLFLEGEH